MFQGKLVMNSNKKKAEMEALQVRYSNISAIRKTSITQYNQS